MDRTEKCEKKFSKLFGGKPTVSEGSDPEFMRILQRFIFGEVSYTGSLDDRMRELITVTVLTVYQTLPQLKAHTAACLNIGKTLPQLKAHTAACLNIGVTPVEIRETVYRCAPFIGFPKTLNAIAAINEVFTEKGITLPLENCETVTESDRYEKGLALQAPVYGTEIAERYEWLPEEFSRAVPRFLTELCFSDFMTRRGQDEKTSELLTVVMLAAIGGADLQVRSHVEGALKVGCTKEEIVCALVCAMPYTGFPRLFNALNCSKELLS